MRMVAKNKLKLSSIDQIMHKLFVFPFVGLNIVRVSKKSLTS